MTRCVVVEDDVLLVQRCRTGDQDAMVEFVARFQGAVFSVCYRMLCHRHDAEDVTQDVFLRAFRSLYRWDSIRPLRPWLLAIAVNRCRTFLEKRSKQAIAANGLVQAAAEARPNGSRDLGEELQQGIEKLRDTYRTCFILFYQDQLSCSEIGQAMNVPAGTVKTWLHRARRELAEHLARRGIVPDGQYELHRV